GYRYVAAVTDRPQEAIAPAMLARAEELERRVFQPARDALEQERAVLAAMDEEDPGYEAQQEVVAQREAEYAAAEAQMVEVTSMVDTGRAFGAVFGGAGR